MLSRPHSRTPGRSRCTCCARDLLFCALLCIVCALVLGACCVRVWWVCARDSALCARLFIVCALLFILGAQLSSAFCARVLWVGARGFCFLCVTFYFLCANLGHFLCALFVGLCAGFNFLCATFYFLCAILPPIVYRWLGMLVLHLNESLTFVVAPLHSADQGKTLSAQAIGEALGGKRPIRAQPAPLGRRFAAAKLH